MTIDAHTFSLHGETVQRRHECFPAEETTGETPNFFVFCDVLSEDDADQKPVEENAALKALIEQWIQEHLEQQCRNGQGINEMLITSAFEYAHQKLTQFNSASTERLAVSGVVLAYVNNEQTQQCEILIGGLGDIRVFQVVKDQLKLVFSDPNTPQTTPKTSVEERISNLSNGIGIGDSISVYCHRLPADATSHNVIATYGFYDQSNDEEISSIALHPSNDRVTPLIESKVTNGHHLSVNVLTHHVNKTPARPQQKNRPRPIAQNQSQRKKQRKIATTLTMGTCVLVLLLGTQLMRPHENVIEAEALPVDTTALPQLAEVQTQNQELTLQLQRLGSLINQKDEQIDSLKEQVELTRTQNNEELTTHLAEELEERNSLISKLNVSNSNFREEISNQEKKIHYLEKTIATLEGVIDEQDHSQGDSVEKLQKEVSYLQEKGETEKEQLLSALKTIEQSESALKATLSEKEQEIDSLQQQRDSLLARVSDEETKQQAFSTQLTDQLEEANKVRNDLQTIINEQKELIASAAEENRVLKVNESQLAQTRVQLEIEKTRQEELQGTINTLNRNNAMLAEKNQDLVARAETLEEYQTRYVSERKQRLEKENLFKQLSSSLREQKVVLSQIQNSRTSLMRELEKSKSDYQQLLNEYQDLAQTQVRIKPQTVTTSRPGTVHKVARGETLSQISLQYYGTAKKWPEILEANRNVISDEKQVRVGLSLVIPSIDEAIR